MRRAFVDVVGALCHPPMPCRTRSVIAADDSVSALNLMAASGPEKMLIDEFAEALLTTNH
jgi:hypothetical protein